MTVEVQKHSDIFKIYAKKIEGILQLCLPPGYELWPNYQNLAYLLLEINEAQFGIVTRISSRADQKQLLIRDAREAIPLSKRIPQAHPSIQVNQLLLRVLAKVQAIDYALTEMDKKHPLKNKLKAEFSQFLQGFFPISTEEPYRLQAREQGFNSILFEKILIPANLAIGCYDAEQAASLLSFYAVLSSVLEPAKSVLSKTLIRSKQGRCSEIWETQQPVTEKIDSDQILADNQFLGKPEAFRIAQRLFSKRLQADDSLLASSARRFIPYGVKNAFICTVQINPNDSHAASPLHFLRMGAAVYQGQGLSEAEVQQHTRVNIQQIVKVAMGYLGLPSKHQLDIVCLNTNTWYQGQERIISHLKQAVQQAPNEAAVQLSFSNIPCNFQGTFYKAHFHVPDYRTAAAAVPMDVRSQYARAAGYVYALSQQKQVPRLPIITCAAGQDRTGTLHFMLVQHFLHAHKLAELAEIQEALATSGNVAYMATHQASMGGNPGLKPCSVPRNYLTGGMAFPQPIVKALYLPDAAKASRDFLPVNKAFLGGNALQEEYFQTALMGWQRQLILSMSGRSKDKLDARELRIGSAAFELSQALVAAPRSNRQALELLITLLETSRKAFAARNVPAEHSRYQGELLALYSKCKAQKGLDWLYLTKALLLFTGILVLSSLLLATIPFPGQAVSIFSFIYSSSSTNAALLVAGLFTGSLVGAKASLASPEIDPLSHSLQEFRNQLGNP